MPADAQARAQAVSWLFAALNTVELSAYRLFRYRLQQSPNEPIWRGDVQATLNRCLSRMETVLQNREWLAGDFSVADIAMSDVLRLAAHFGALADAPACRDYVARATARPAFIKAHQDQLAHFGKTA
ncbi:glutathione binding-like protein [Vandammella animalimorsus]|uniref:glutathione S-transferase family protein n=1 Tax=Vandammella animalimorsus TaxID=2029117 RepID=UPI0031BBCA12